MILFILCAIVILAIVALRLAMPRLTANSVAAGIVENNGQSALGDCPDTPNCQGSESSRNSQQVQRITLTKPAGAAIDSMATVVRSMPGATIIRQDTRYLSVTFKTRIMAYIDDVEFLVSDDDASLQVRSASRLGKSDFGANAKRIDLLRELSKGQL